MPSSVIRAFDYDAATQRLEVLFISGRRYTYHGVPPEIADGMRRAFSKGEYFNQYIRERYGFTRDRARDVNFGGATADSSIKMRPASQDPSPQKT